MANYENGGLGIDIEGGFIPKYKILPDKVKLVEELKIYYPKLFRKYPHILVILKTFTYGEDKRILLDEHYRISRSTDRKMILCLFDKYKSQRNNLDLIEAIFAPDYSSLSDAMTTDYPMGKMKNLENFLKQKEEIFFRN